MNVKYAYIVHIFSALSTGRHQLRGIRACFGLKSGFANRSLQSPVTRCH